MRRAAATFILFPSMAGIASLAGCANRTHLDEARVIDLTYPFDEHTVYWPTAKGFELKRVARGPNAAGQWYAANEFCAAEHGGTHLDAPLHFAESRQSAADIPLARLMGPARVIDIRQACAADRDYLLAASDVEAHESLHGRLEAGTVALVLTGWGERYPDVERYLGSTVRGKAEGLHFPGIGPEAARLLVERRVDLVGIDTASIDHGPSMEFTAHRILSAANIPGLENLANLALLPPAGATVIALPMKIADGTGGPCRIVAFLP